MFQQIELQTLFLWTSSISKRDRKWKKVYLMSIIDLWLYCSLTRSDTISLLCKDLRWKEFENRPMELSCCPPCLREIIISCIAKKVFPYFYLLQIYRFYFWQKNHKSIVKFCKWNCLIVFQEILKFLYYLKFFLTSIFM